MSVYVTTYEVIGEGLPIAAAHFAAIEAARSAHWTYVESVGGVGFRPGSAGGLRSVYFREVPRSWRAIGQDGDKIECVPHKGGAGGKRIAKEIDELPTAPQGERLARDLGYAPDSFAIDGNRIFFPTALQVAYPAERAFVRLPRFHGDNFDPNASLLLALPESDFMKAIEDHNAEARRRREAGA